MNTEDYQPPWNLLPEPESVREHLVAAHGFEQWEVRELRDAECWELHSRCHEAKLGELFVGG